MDRRSVLLADAARARLVADALRRAAELDALCGYDRDAEDRASAALAELARAALLERQALQNAASERR